ncbi:MAG TPA: hypothetical protein DCP40_12915 [Stenotrophomonas sp.]|nr:hypothetical protein [Stenotrophomonas sp.]
MSGGSGGTSGPGSGCGSGSGSGWGSGSGGSASIGGRLLVPVVSNGDTAQRGCSCIQCPCAVPPASRDATANTLAMDLRSNTDIVLGLR